MLALGENFDVSSALCAWVDDAHSQVPAPDVEAPDKPKKRKRIARRRFLRLMEGAFVVPDGYVDQPMAAEDADSGPEEQPEDVYNFEARGRIADADGDEAMDIDVKDIVRGLTARGQRRSL